MQSILYSAFTSTNTFLFFKLG
uniref:Uncharacterized protein n=1 Tax=Anguilla anguilla TaxID=7936 RepID=A0A0E9SKV0_ANGAN